MPNLIRPDKVWRSLQLLRHSSINGGYSGLEMKGGSSTPLDMSCLHLFFKAGFTALSFVIFIHFCKLGSVRVEKYIILKTSISVV